MKISVLIRLTFLMILMLLFLSSPPLAESIEASEAFPAMAEKCISRAEYQQKKTDDVPDATDFCRSFIPHKSDHNESSEEIKKIEIDSGIYVSQIHTLDFIKGSYTIVFWVWWNHPDDNFQPEKSIEWVGAREIQWNIIRKSPLPDGSYHTGAQVTATISQLWDVSDYPLDVQLLKLVMESADMETRRLQYGIDVNDSIVEPSLHIRGWSIMPLQARTENFKYLTKFGNKNENFSTYPRIVYEIPIVRNGLRILINNFIGYIISISLILLVCYSCSKPLLRDNLVLPGRAMMAVAAIFLAIGNKNSIDSTFPPTTSFSTIDVIQVFVFCMIPITVVCLFYTEGFAKSGQLPKANRIGQITFRFISISFLLVIGIIIYRVAI